MDSLDRAVQILAFVVTASLFALVPSAATAFALAAALGYNFATLFVRADIPEALLEWMQESDGELAQLEEKIAALDDMSKRVEEQRAAIASIKNHLGMKSLQ